MTLMDIPGVSNLTKETLALVNEAEIAGTRMRDTENLFALWKAYRERVSMEISLNGPVEDVKAFDKIAQEYMEDYLKTSRRNPKLCKKVGMFKYEGYSDKYRKSLLNYFNQTKKYKKSMKTAANAVFHDPQGSNELDNIFAEKLQMAKGDFKYAKNLKVGEFGLPLGLKIAKGVGILGLAGLVTWGTIKAYKYITGLVKINKRQDPTYTYYTQPNNQTPGNQPKPAAEQPANELFKEEVIEEPVPTQTQIVLTGPDIVETDESQSEVDTPVEPSPNTTENTVVEGTPVDETSQKPEAEVQKEKAEAVATRAAKRAAFNAAISQIKKTLSTEGIECGSYTVVKNDTLSKIAVTTLKQEGIEKPTTKEIHQRIALIALLNGIEDVNKLYINQTLKLPSAELNAYIERNNAYYKLLSEIAAKFV